jgi:hypothetical protein
MDDDRIRRLTNEVLSALGDEAPGAGGHPLEERVAALETEVAELRRQLGSAGPAASVSALAVTVHPSLRLLSLGPNPSRCVLEPAKPCCDSGQCRTLGH